MRKVLFTLVLAALGSLGLQAQGTTQRQNAEKPTATTYRWKVEAEAGVCCSVLDTDVSGLGTTSYMVRPGFTANIAAEYNIVDHLAVGTDIRFLQRDYMYQNQGGDSWHTRYNNNFISIPLTVGYYIFHNPYCEKGLWMKPQVGVYYEYLVVCKV